MGDAGCLLFEDLPRDRTMRWIEDAGVSVYRAPSGYANGQTRDLQGRLISCSHRERCLFRTELDGSITRLVDRHGGGGGSIRPMTSPSNPTERSGSPIPCTVFKPTMKAAASPRNSRRIYSLRSRHWRDRQRRGRRLRRSQRSCLLARRAPTLCRRDRRPDLRQPETIYSRV